MSKFAWEKGELSSVGICAGCVHLRGYYCDAFPGGIPIDVLLGKISHRRPVQGDNGIQLEPLPKEAKSNA